MPRASNQLQHQSGSSVYHEARGADGSIASARSLKTLADCVDQNTDRLKVDIEDASGQGLATEAKQQDQISKLTEIDTAVDAMSAKITTGSDDSISGSLQQNLVYGRFGGDGSLKAAKTSSDGSLITAPAGGTIITTDGTTSEQRVMMLAHSGGNLRTVLCDGNGALIVDPSEDSIITADGVTQEQRVMLNGNHNGNLRTVKVGEDGAVAMELDYSWDNTNEIFTNETVADGAQITSSTFDLGQGVSHDLGNVEFFHTNSASVEIEVTAEVSPDGTNWYSLNGLSFASNQLYVSHNQEEVGISIGHRYMRLVVTNNDGLGASTNITTKVAYYK